MPPTRNRGNGREDKGEEAKQIEECGGVDTSNVRNINNNNTNEDKLKGVSKTAIRKNDEICKNMFPKNKSKLDLSVLAERCLDLVETEQVKFETMVTNSIQFKQCCEEKNALQVQLSEVNTNCEQLGIDRVALQKKLDELNSEVKVLQVRVSTQESERAELLTKLDELERTKDVLTQKLSDARQKCNNQEALIMKSHHRMTSLFRVLNARHSKLMGDESMDVLDSGTAASSSNECVSECEKQAGMSESTTDELAEEPNVNNAETSMATNMELDNSQEDNNIEDEAGITTELVENSCNIITDHVSNDTRGTSKVSGKVRSLVSRPPQRSSLRLRRHHERQQQQTLKEAKNSSTDSVVVDVSDDDKDADKVFANDYGQHDDSQHDINYDATTHDDHNHNNGDDDNHTVHNGDKTVTCSRPIANTVRVNGDNSNCDIVEIRNNSVNSDSPIAVSLSSSSSASLPTSSAPISTSTPITCISTPELPLVSLARAASTVAPIDESFAAIERYQPLNTEPISPPANEPVTDKQAEQNLFTRMQELHTYTSASINMITNKTPDDQFNTVDDAIDGLDYGVSDVDDIGTANDGDNDVVDNDNDDDDSDDDDDDDDDNDDEVGGENDDKNDPLDHDENKEHGDRTNDDEDGNDDDDDDDDENDDDDDDDDDDENDGSGGVGVGSSYEMVIENQTKEPIIMNKESAEQFISQLQNQVQQLQIENKKQREESEKQLQKLENERAVQKQKLDEQIKEVQKLSSQLETFNTDYNSNSTKKSKRHRRSSKKHDIASGGHRKHDSFVLNQLATMLSCTVCRYLCPDMFQILNLKRTRPGDLHISSESCRHFVCMHCYWECKSSSSCPHCSRTTNVVAKISSQLQQVIELLIKHFPAMSWENHPTYQKDNVLTKNTMLKIDKIWQVEQDDNKVYYHIPSPYDFCMAVLNDVSKPTCLPNYKITSPTDLTKMFNTR